MTDRLLAQISLCQKRVFKCDSLFFLCDSAFHAYGNPLLLSQLVGGFIYLSVFFPKSGIRSSACQPDSFISRGSKSKGTSLF